MNTLEIKVGPVVQTNSDVYEAPSIESVVLPGDIEREVAYAGVIAPSDATPA